MNILRVESVNFTLKIGVDVSQTCKGRYSLIFTSHGPLQSLFPVQQIHVHNAREGLHSDSKQLEYCYFLYFLLVYSLLLNSYSRLHCTWIGYLCIRIWTMTLLLPWLRLAKSFGNRFDNSPAHDTHNNRLTMLMVREDQCCFSLHLFPLSINAVCYNVD